MDDAAAQTLRQEVYGAFNDRDFDLILDHTTSGVTLQSPALGLDVKGHDAVMAWLQGWADMSSDLEVTVDRSFVAGDHLINEIHGEGTHDGPMQTPWGTLDPTGRRFRATAMEVWETRGGKISAFRSEPDLTTIFSQLGHPPHRFDLEARVREFYELINKGAVDELESMLDPEFINHEHLAGMPPGREGVREFMETMRTAFPDFRMTIDDVLVDRDTAVIRLRMSGTHRGDLMGIPPTNRSFEVETIDIVRFEGELAAEHWGVTDAMAMFEKLGLIDVPMPTTP